MKHQPQTMHRYRYSVRVDATRADRLAGILAAASVAGATASREAVLSRIVEEGIDSLPADHDTTPPDAA